MSQKRIWHRETRFTRNLSVRVPSILFAELERNAQAGNTTISRIVIQALHFYLEEFSVTRKEVNEDK